MSGEKTEKPTPKKLKEGRKEGKVARTPDLGAWAGMLAASMLLPMVLRNTMSTAEVLFLRATKTIKDPDPADAIALLSQGLRDAAVAVAPLAVGLLVIAVAASAAQGGLHPATKLLVPKFSRLNPWPGIKRSFGPKAGWEAAKVVAKTSALGAVLYYSARDLVPLLMASGAIPLGSLVTEVSGAAVGLIRAAAVAGLVMAAADYAVVRRRTNKELRMSKSDVKQENKNSEGDPQQKGHIRSKQMAMSRNRMMSEVVHADVVVVNPTHIAVALRYDPLRGAPRVVAKGAGVIAAKIREVAAEKRIPTVQDIPLARTLHRNCELGQEIPPELFGAVAKVLAFVMTLKARGSAAGLHRQTATRAA